MKNGGPVYALRSTPFSWNDCITPTFDIEPLFTLSGSSDCEVSSSAFDFILIGKARGKNGYSEPGEF